MNCQIRKATIDDLPTIYTFELGYIREIEAHMEARWKNAMPLHLKQWISNLSRMFVAVQEDKVIGHCFWEAHDKEAVLASIYVLPEGRRCGCGSLLVEQFEEDARQRGFVHLALGVHEDNPAYLLYLRHGYRQTHVADNYCYYKKAI